MLTDVKHCDYQSNSYFKDHRVEEQLKGRLG